MGTGIRRAGGGLMFWIAACGGCGGFSLPVNNCEPPPEPTRTQVAAGPGAILANEAGAEDALWLQIDRQRGEGTVGGYLSPETDHRGALVVLLPGASTYDIGGSREAALDFHRYYGVHFRDQRFRVWTVALREDQPYGQGSIDDALEAVDWLEGAGKSFLGVERIYLVGYSIGAITAGQVDTQRPLTAAVCIAGLTQPDQIKDLSLLYSSLAGLFPCNTGFAQMRATIESANWDALDLVSRVDEIRNPTLFLHGEEDVIFFSSNTHNLEAAYRTQLATSRFGLAPLSFMYLPDGTHLGYLHDPTLAEPVVAYLLGFEPD